MQVGSFGFPEQQRSKVEKILRLSRQRDYELVTFDGASLPDVLLVFGEESLSAPSLRELPADYRQRLVIVSRQKPTQHDCSHIGYPLVSSRVIRVLDSINVDIPTLGQAEPVQLKTEPVSEPPTLAEPDVLLTQEQLRAGTLQATSDEDPLHVLVVDDSAPMRQALADQLAALSIPMHISFAESGQEALAVTEHYVFDLIFMDIMMPGIDGFEACTQMRKKPEIKKTPIIMLSSKTSPLDEVKGIMAGCSTYLTKPIVPEEFQKVIRRVSKWIMEYRPERAAHQTRETL